MVNSVVPGGQGRSFRLVRSPGRQLPDDLNDEDGSSINVVEKMGFDTVTGKILDCYV